MQDLRASARLLLPIALWTGLAAGGARAQALLHEWSGTSLQAGFGRAVDGAGDADGDGFADLVVGSPDASSPATAAGAARVYSPWDRTLFAAPQLLSVAAGGPASLTLIAGLEHGGKLYFILASLTGTASCPTPSPPSPW